MQHATCFIDHPPSIVHHPPSIFHRPPSIAIVHDQHFPNQVKIKQDGYKLMTVDDAVRDCELRIDNYRKQYVTLDGDAAEKDKPFMKVGDVVQFFLHKPRQEILAKSYPSRRMGVLFAELVPCS
jgi:hypothetical protein